MSAVSSSVQEEERLQIIGSLTVIQFMVVKKKKKLILSFSIKNIGL